jgi:serine/threonine protein kinase
VLKTLPGLGPGGAERLKEEARAMAALNHDCLATIYGVEIWRRTPVLVVEYFADGTLEDRLDAGPLSVEDAVRLGISLANALSYMHAEGVLHRDLKPSNIALTAAGAPRLLDFGLALLTDSSRGERRVAGTRAYLPPEAFHGATSSAAFDLWALACVLREAVAGGERSSAFAAVLARALARAPELRYQSGPELAAALVTVLATLDLPPPLD